MPTGMQVIKSIKDGLQKPPEGIVTLGLDRGQRWIDHFESGFARMVWEADPRYYNLEDAVICSWLACLADQAVFYATNTLVEDGEVTRIRELSMTYLRNISSGRVVIESRVEGRSDNLMFTRVVFLNGEEGPAAMASATTQVVKQTAGSRSA